MAKGKHYNGKLLTPKQSAFAETVAIENCTYSEAYRKHYNASKMSDRTLWTEANKLAHNPKVSAKIKELRQEMKERGIYNVEKCTREFEQVRKQAMASNELSSANTAINGKAKVNGLFNFTQEHKQTISIEFVNLLKNEMNSNTVELGVNEYEEIEEE